MTRGLRGVGIGLRASLARELFDRRPPEIAWLEVHPENYLRRGGRFAALLEEAEDVWPLVTHGLSRCLGSAERFCSDDLRDLRRLLERVDSPWHSEHLCFGGVANAHLHDLLPLPRTASAMDAAVDRVRELQDATGRTIAIENVSTYLETAFDELDEASFMLEVMERSNAALLLDVNNVFVNSKNHGFDPFAFVDRIPAERVVQIHIAGHEVQADGLRVDTHAEPVCSGVLSLLEHTLRRVGDVPILLERDGKIPPLDALLQEVRVLESVRERALASGPHRATPAPRDAPC